MTTSFLATLRRLRSKSLRAVDRIERKVPRRGFRSRPFGVTVVGPTQSHFSRAVMTRRYVHCLESAGIPFEVLDPASCVRPLRRWFRYPYRRPRGRYAFTLLLSHPLFFDHRALPGSLLNGRYVMAHWIWEQTTLPERMLAQLELVDEVWIASEFVRETYRNSTRTSTVLMPQVATRERQDGHDIEPHDGGPTSRSRFGIPEDRFVFLTIASALSSHVRKNPVGAMHAFRAAFPHGQREAVLVIKLLPTEGELGDLGVFTEDPAFGPDVHLLVESLTDDEMTELLQTCACFVSLHRNEGFGLGAAEAMSLGLPAIITAWSGSVDYMTDTNCLAVPFTLRRIEDPGLPWYAPGLEWAEPDLEVAASYMRRVFDEPDLAERLGTQGRIDIWNAYSVEAVGRAISTHLESLYRR